MKNPIAMLQNVSSIQTFAHTYWVIT